MKLVRFLNPSESYGIFDADKVISIPMLASALGEEIPTSLEALISQSIRESTLMSMIQKASRETLSKALFPLNKVKLLAPVLRPPKIVCLGLNYKDHAAEQKSKPPDEPVIFMKPATAIIGPDDNIVKPSFVKQLDYEAELAIVIGKETKDVSVNDAESHIYGYTIFNDVSARGIQFQDKQWTRGKSFDTFAPTGPCITTVNQIKDPNALKIRTWVNKELRQNSTTQNMALNVFEIVHHLSRVMTLRPCDFIATGTPAGVGFAMRPKPRFLQNGDVVEIEIKDIGILRNSVVDAQH